MPRLLVIGAIVCASFSSTVCHSSSCSGEDTVFFVVRHAEKLDESADSELSPQGKNRAEQLIRDGLAQPSERDVRRLASALSSPGLVVPAERGYTGDGMLEGIAFDRRLPMGSHF